jgi:membrane protease YdiL (CAAX protease family)
VAAVVGTVIATTAAGAAFGWLRYGSKSLVAPIAAHIATNSVAFATAWVLAN